MCILCTRCVRACREIRHTGAIALAGRGHETRIAFGLGGPVHESNCDFCGACIDLCPTATLMERPHKWIGHPDRWVPTACLYCSVGCTVAVGTKMGRAVIVKPDPQNPVSLDQICVRGRFHYDAIRAEERLAQPLLRRNGQPSPASWEEALDWAVARLADIVRRHGPGAVAFLGSPWNSNEENYLLQKLARAVVGTNNVDTSLGPVARGAAAALRRTLGTELLQSDLACLAHADTILAIAEDLESSHNIACLRIKDAVVRRGACLIVVASRWGELCDFARLWLRPRPGQEALALAALTRRLLSRREVQEALPAPVTLPADDIALEPSLAEAVEGAASLLAGRIGQGEVAVLYALPPIGPQAAEAVTQEAANLAILLAGPQEAAESLYLLPPEGNGVGLRDMGLTPELLPGYRPVEDEAARREVEGLWGIELPAQPGLPFPQALAAAREGRLKALLVLGDNPFLLAPDREGVAQALASLELLLLIDGAMTEVARRAHVLLPDGGPWAREGTATSADRRLLRLRRAIQPPGEARPAWWALMELGRRLARELGRGVPFDYRGPGEVMDEIASLVAPYGGARYRDLIPAQRLDVPLDGVSARLVPTEPAPPREGLLLFTGRTLYTSLEGAAIGSPEADKLHREEFALLHPSDASPLAITDGAEVALVNGRARLTLRARLTEEVLPGSVFVPLYYRGGAVTALFTGPQAAWGVAPVRLERP